MMSPKALQKSVCLCLQDGKTLDIRTGFAGIPDVLLGLSAPYVLSTVSLTFET